MKADAEDCMQVAPANMQQFTARVTEEGAQDLLALVISITLINPVLSLFLQNLS